MAEANGGDHRDQPGWQWDVALSFAGAQRNYVEQVAQALRERGVRCFYDADEQIELWGKYLAEELPLIYGEQAAAVVVFVSAEYAARDWARQERRAALARAVRERREYVLPARFDDTSLPGLLPDMVAVDLRTRSPQQFAAMIAGKLVALGIMDPALPASRADPGIAGEGIPPAGRVRVAEADLRRLGVHAAISVPGVPDEVPPEYVLRDVDDAEHGVRAKVMAAARRGGFVLLVGGSSVGKTRSAAEAVKVLLPDWWLVHPADAAEVTALADAPTPQLVVWLDELQRYLDGEQGLTGAVVRALLNARQPVVIIGTLWPDRYAAYTALPVSDDADPHARQREVLGLAAAIRVDPDFSPAEHDRTRAAAARDPRLRVALEAAGYGPTQILAAAPQLVARWQDAKTASPYGWAVLTAALDIARLGARAPLSAGLLRAAAPGYCTSQQQAEAPGDWFEQALAYATAKLHGAAAALSPAGSGMGEIDGYSAADYLIQHATRERRYARVPTGTWDALLSHIRDPADTARLGASAMNRLLHLYAIPLLRRATDAGNERAAWQLTGLLAQRGDLDGLRARADAGDRYATAHLSDLLARHGDQDGAIRILRPRADAGDKNAARQLARLLARHGDLGGLRARIDAGDVYATLALADLLAERGDLDELRARTDAGDRHAARQLAALLARHGDLEGLRARANAGDVYATLALADLLARHDDLDGATQILRAQIDAGDTNAALRLAGLLAQHGDLDGAARTLRAEIDAGDANAGWQLAKLLAESGDLDGLRARADAGDTNAAWQLAKLLAQRGDLDGLRARASAGDEHATQELAGLSARPDDPGGLRARADAGDFLAAVRLAELLAERGDLDELRARTDAGDPHASGQLPELLRKQGRGEEAERLRRFGLLPDGSIASA
jgi:hypothetical protein